MAIGGEYIYFIFFARKGKHPMRNEVKISYGNSKIGRIANISLPPIMSCPKDVPCSIGCYALKSYRLYENVRKAWDWNLKLLKDDPYDYFGSLIDQLKRKKQLKRFRWHVSGDIVDLMVNYKIMELFCKINSVKRKRLSTMNMK